MKAKHVALTVLATLVAGFALFLVVQAHRSAADVHLARLRFVVGERISYHVEWTVKAGAGIAPAEAKGLPQQLAMTSKLTGTIDVETLAVAPGEATLAVSFAELDDFSFDMHGQNAVQDRAATVASLRGKRAFVTMTTRGEVKSIAFDDALAPGARNALRSLVMQMQLSLPADARDTWEAEEAVAVGRMRFGYAGNATTIRRSPYALVAVDAAPGATNGTQAVRGEATFALASGQLQSIEDRETWSYTRSGATTPAVSHDSVFVLRRVATSTVDVSQIPRPRLPGHSLGETAADADIEARLDAALAREMTRDKLVSSIEHFELGQKADHELVARAAAFLRLHPEAAQALVAEFKRADFTARGRGMILDVLAAAGDANAQATMRDLLMTRQAHDKTSRFGVLVQRFTFVVKPDAKTVRFLETLLRESRTTDLAAAQGAAASLGAVARRLVRNGDPTAAQQATSLLAEELAGATNTDHMRALIAGLGNAGDATHVPLLASYATHDDPRVRAEVAGAFGTIRSDAARGALLDMVRDGDGSVSVLAFSALASHTLRDGEWSKLADVARDKQSPVSADGSFVDLVRKQRDSAGAHGIEILQALQTRNAGPDNDLGHAIGQLLAQK